MKDWKTGETKDQEIIDDALQAAWTNGVLEAAEPIEEGEERVSVDGNAVLEALAHNGYMVVKVEPSQRGFLHGDPVKTDYGADVSFSESSSAEGPHIWLRAQQPELGPSPPYLEPFDAACHMTLEQARQIHANLGGMIEIVAGRWGEDSKEEA